MGIFDGVSSSLFAQAPDGRTLFRPFGQLGGTYEVPADRAEQLQRWTRRYTIVLFAAILIATQLWRLSALLLLPVFLAPMLVKFWHFSRTLPRTSDEPVAVGRAARFTAYARAIGTPALIVVSVISVLLFAVGAWLCVVQPGRDAYFVAGFFGLCTLVNGAALLASLKRDR